MKKNIFLSVVLWFSCVNMYSEKVQSCILYEFQLGHSARKASENLQKVFREDAVLVRMIER